VLATVQMDVAKNQMRDEVIHQHEDQLAVLEKAEDWHAIIRAVDTMSSVVDEWSDTRHGRDLQRVIETYVERARRRLRIVAGE
jgi:phage terminase small subunit